MSKIGLIIRREYLSKVRSKAFVIMTFLAPIALAAIMVVPAWLASLESGTVFNVSVVDQKGLYQAALPSTDKYIFSFVEDQTPEQLLAQKQEGIDVLMVISDDLSQDSSAVSLYAEQQVNEGLKHYIEKQIEEYLQDQKIASFAIEGFKEKVAQSKVSLDIATYKWDETGQNESSYFLAVMVGLVTTMLIYFFIFTYGAQVMKSVSEEKLNRIVEIIVSAVTPFELMMGKIIGVALVGLTQVLMWGVFSGVIVFAVSLFATVGSVGSIGATSGEMMQYQESITRVLTYLSTLNLPLIFSCFILFFLGGYLLYASFFAAIGSVVDHNTDGNQFMLVITIPIIFALYVAVYALENPDGAAAVWCSIIPFTSSVVMMVRLPFGVPTWQIVLSLVLLFGSFIGSVWIAGRIYRTGILMYGKKITWSELYKWIRFKV